MPDGHAPMISVEHSHPDHSRVVLVDWTLGTACNHACSYCPPALHDGSSPWHDLSAATDFLHLLADHYRTGLGKNVWLQFTGGEPTLYPQFFDLMARAENLGLKRSVISNGSRTERFWQRAVSCIDSAILTYHDEGVDHDRFAAICALISDRHPLHVNVTAHPDRFETILTRVQDLRARVPLMSVTLKPLRLGFRDSLYPYTPEQMEILAGKVSTYGNAPATFPRGTMDRVAPDGQREPMRANNFILRGENRWRGYRCLAGLESLRVKADGSVTRAVCGVGGILGKLGGPVTLPVTAVTCDRDACSCVADILITKRRTHASDLVQA